MSERDTLFSMLWLNVKARVLRTLRRLAPSGRGPFVGHYYPSLDPDFVSISEFLDNGSGNDKDSYRGAWHRPRFTGGHTIVMGLTGTGRSNLVFITTEELKGLRNRDVRRAMLEKAMVLAVEKRNPELVSMILNMDSELDVSRALAVAAAHGCPQCASMLVRRARNQDQLDYPSPFIAALHASPNEGLSPLMAAIFNGREKTVLELLPFSDMSVKSIHGKTALDMAREVSSRPSRAFLAGVPIAEAVEAWALKSDLHREIKTLIEIASDTVERQVSEAKRSSMRL